MASTRPTPDPNALHELCQPCGQRRTPCLISSCCLPPPRDLFKDRPIEQSVQNQFEFLVQRLGGPPVYSERKGGWGGGQLGDSMHAVGVAGWAMHAGVQVPAASGWAAHPARLSQPAPGAEAHAHSLPAAAHPPAPCRPPAADVAPRRLPLHQPDRRPLAAARRRGAGRGARHRRRPPPPPRALLHVHGQPAGGAPGEQGGLRHGARRRRRRLVVG